MQISIFPSFKQSLIHWQILAFFSPLKDKTPVTTPSQSGFYFVKTILIFFSSSLLSEERRKHKTHPWKERIYVSPTCASTLGSVWNVRAGCWVLQLLPRECALVFALNLQKFHSCKCLWTFSWCPHLLSVASQCSKCQLLSPWSIWWLSGIPR